jgi:hypothetical protein
LSGETSGLGSIASLAQALMCELRDHHRRHRASEETETLTVHDRAARITVWVVRAHRVDKYVRVT